MTKGVNKVMLKQTQYYSSADHFHQLKYFQWTGEKRKPRKGEWFLFGAILKAYLAYNDLDFIYPIADPVSLKVCPHCDGRGKVIDFEDR